MIIFHEGLPGSGKSYEALVRRIIPAITAGRSVVAYVEGLDHAKIAELAGVSLERCQELLKPITRDDVADIAAHSVDNALVVLDEAQNFWGTSAKLNKATTQFVTEHRHRGIDIILMGQSIKDVNAIWRRRVELKLCFLKLSGLGSSKRYSVTTWRHKGDDKYVKVGTVLSTYDPKFFGSYASHVSDDTNTADYRDVRGTVLGSALFKYGLPLAVVIALIGGWKLWQFFHPAALSPAASAAAGSSAAVPVVRAAPGPAAAASSARPAQVVEARPRPAVEVYLSGLSGARLRLAGLARMGDRVSGVVEWVSGDMRVMERMSLDTLRQLGVAVVVSGETVQLAVGDWIGFATPWPVDGEFRMSERRLEQMRDQGAAGVPHGQRDELVASAGAAPAAVMPGSISVGESSVVSAGASRSSFGAR